MKNIYKWKFVNGYCQVSEIWLYNKCDFTLWKSKILHMNFTQPAGTVTAYPMLNISFELA